MTVDIMMETVTTDAENSEGLKWEKYSDSIFTVSLRFTEAIKEWFNGAIIRRKARDEPIPKEKLLILEREYDKDRLVLSKDDIDTNLDVYVSTRSFSDALKFLFNKHYSGSTYIMRRIGWYHSRCGVPSYIYVHATNDKPFIYFKGASQSSRFSFEHDATADDWFVTLVDKKDLVTDGAKRL
jgi:hypothetical protein